MRPPRWAIARTTAKTHLQRVFEKTGNEPPAAGRQARPVGIRRRTDLIGHDRRASARGDPRDVLHMADARRPSTDKIHRTIRTTPPGRGGRADRPLRAGSEHDLDHVGLTPERSSPCSCRPAAATGDAEVGHRLGRRAQARLGGLTVVDASGHQMMSGLAPYRDARHQPAYRGRHGQDAGARSDRRRRLSLRSDVQLRRLAERVAGGGDRQRHASPPVRSGNAGPPSACRRRTSISCD